MKNKKPKIITGLGVVYFCPICENTFIKLKDAEHCRNSCHQMVLAYMHNNKLNYEKAKSLFLMELL